MKKISIIIFLFILLGAISVLTFNHFNKPVIPKKMKNFNEDDAKKAITNVKMKYGTDMAKIVEKMMRLETRHFKSKQYIQTGSGGMEAGHWANIPNNATSGTIDFKDNQDKHIGHFIVWNSVTDFANYLAEYIKRYKGNFAHWNSTQPDKQIAYQKEVNSITPKFV